MRYRLLTEVPLTISFPSVVYRLEWSHDRGRHKLLLCHLGRSSGYEVTQYSDPPSAGRYQHDPGEAWTDGVTVTRPGVLDTVFVRLVREGRAEVIDGPHARLVWRWPGGRFVP